MPAVWWGAWKGGRRISVECSGSAPATDWSASTLQRCLVVQLGQDLRQALGQHRLARAGRNEEGDVVPNTGGRHLDRVLAEVLTGDVGSGVWPGSGASLGEGE